MKMLGIAALYLLARPSAGDTPVHCLLEQMYGEWTIEMGTPTNTVLTALPSCEGVALPTAATMRLTAPNIISWEGPDTPTGDRRGTFTMVYDEGWEASFEALGPPHGGKPAVKFWGFLDWKVVNTTHVESLCGSVSYGTFHTAPSDASAAPTGWGCYKATKIEAPSPRVHPAPVMPTWTATAAGTYQPLPAPSLHREMPQAVADDRPDKIKYAGLPDSLDWDTEHKVGNMRDQLTCGSCYAFAATSMLASRGRIASVGSAPDLYISPQDMISCGSPKTLDSLAAAGSGYGQGCAGGFGYLVAKCVNLLLCSFAP